MTTWKRFENWLRKFLSKVRAVIRDSGIGEFTAKIISGVNGNVMRLVHRVYYKEDGKWFEQTTVREIAESEVPAWAKEGLSAREINVTPLYEKQLELSV